MAALFAATYPERTAGLVMIGSYAKRIRDATLQERFKHVAPAEAIVEAEAQRFVKDWARRRVGPVIDRLTQGCDAKRQAIVQTVLGPIDASDMGPTLVHEHVYFSYPGDALDPTGTWTRADAVAIGIERMQQLKDNGIRTIVDPCPIEMGRDPELSAEVSPNQCQLA